MPAAAVIPAPRVYIKVVAVKELVVVSSAEVRSLRLLMWRLGKRLCFFTSAYFWRHKTRDGRKNPTRGLLGFTLKKLGCSKQANRLEYISMG